MSNKYSFGDTGSKRSIPFVGSFVQLIVIAIGLYLALSIQNWNKSKKESVLEQKYLTALLEEVKFNQTLIEEDQDFRLGQEKMFLKLMESRNRGVDRDTLDRALKLLTKQRAFLPNLAIRNDLLSSGHLSIIQSDSIRYRILSDEQKRNRVASAEMSERSYIENQLVDYLITKNAYSLLSFEEDFNEIIISERDARLITNTLLRDPSFFDHLYARLTRLQAVISSAEPVLLNLSSLELKLEEELSKVD